MFKGKKSSTFLAMIMMIIASGLIGCTDVVPKVSLLRGQLDNSSKIVFAPFIPSQNPANDYSEKFATASGTGYSAYKVTVVPSVQSCSSVDFTSVLETASGKGSFIPTADGAYVFCAIGKVAVSGSWQQASQAVSSSILEVDTLAPQTSSFTINTQATYTKTLSVNLQLASIGATQMFITQDPSCNTGGTWESFNAAKSWTLQTANSLNQIYVKFRDAALNQTSCLSQQITHDGLSPSMVTVDSPVPNSILNASISSSLAFTLSCEINSSIQISGAFSQNINCEPDGHASLVIPFSNFIEGNNSLQLKAVDVAGNESPITTANYFKDTIAPALGTFTSPGPGSYANASNYLNFPVNGTCEIGATVLFDAHEFPCPTGTWATTTNLSSSSDGAVMLSFSQRDTAGNISASTSVTIIKDIVAPAPLTLATLPGTYINQANQSNFTINGSCASGNTVRISYTSGVVDLPCSSSTFSKVLDLSNLNDASYDFNFLQVDPAGNISTGVTATYIKDATPPIVSLAGQPASTSGGEQLSVTVSGPVDLATYKYKLGPQGSTDCGFIFDYSVAISKSTPITAALSTFPDGYLQLCVLGLDAAGNVQGSATTASWIKDTTVAYLKIVERERTVDTGSGAQQFSLELSQTKLYPVQVYFTVEGDSVFGIDHTLANNSSIIIPAGQLTKPLPFNILNNGGVASGYSTLKVRISQISMPLVIPDNLYQSSLYIKYAGALPAPSMVSIGSQHTCSVLNNGKLKCWGDNSFGQLGDGTSVQKSIPTAVDPATSYQYVSAGNSHTCAIKSSNQLMCWGSNSSSELGHSGPNEMAPYIVDSGTSYIQVSAGTQASCGITTSNLLRCWGNNSGNRLGLASLGIYPPTNIGSGYSWVSLGLNHACGLLTDGTLKCWGSNDNGQMGDGTTVARISPGTTDISTKYSDVTVGPNHTCGIVQTTGVLKCWGVNNYGQLGLGDTTTRLSPTIVASGTSFTRVWAGNAHTCALSTAGKMWCWGLNSEGQLLRGHTQTLSSPAITDSTENYATVVAGFNATCGITSTNNLKCGGSNSSGQVGDSTITHKRTPSSTGIPGTFSKIATGFGHTCYLSNSGSISCSGFNAYGQVGDDTLNNRVLATKVEPVTNYVQLAANFYHTCAITFDGKLKCWGRNDKGQIGDGTTINRVSPTLIDSNTNYVKVAVGTYHTCAITNAGVLKCWGKNDTGQLGDNTTTTSPNPIVIDSGVAYSTISAHDSHTCGITTSGFLKCWGDQSYGKQGNGITSGSKLAPTIVDSGVSYVMVATGYDSTCAISTAGQLRCFGFNVYGQIGDGTTNNALYPTTIDSGVSYTRVALGHYHACGITTAGTAKCWGWNDSAQVGNNSLVYQVSPQVIDSGVSYSELALGYNHTCGITTSGTTKCWGNNNYGQYGDGGIPSHWRLALNIMKWLVP